MRHKKWGTPPFGYVRHGGGRPMLGYRVHRILGHGSDHSSMALDQTCTRLAFLLPLLSVVPEGAMEVAMDIGSPLEMIMIMTKGRPL